MFCSNLVIRSGFKWKVTDFGISTVGTARRLIATEGRRGSPLYLAPEILNSQSDIPSYTNKVDIWGLGMIMFELVTGRRAFKSEYDVMEYPRSGTCPQVSESENKHWDGQFDDTLGFAVIEAAVELLLSINTSSDLLPTINSTDIPRWPHLNKQIAWILDRDPFKRPSIDQFRVLMAVNRIIYGSRLVSLHFRRN